MLMQFELLKLLADGKFHSGEKLASELGVSRTAIWKMIPKIEGYGLEVHSVKGKGYRLFEAINLLDKNKILGSVSSAHSKKIQAIEVFPEISSTSSYSMELLRKGELKLGNKKSFICLAEQQSSGKGRRGRQWVSPFGNNIYMTITREFASGVSELEGLSLIVGLAVVRALRKNKIDGLGIKWPNDILWQGKKLAGILLEVSGDPTGVCQVLIGLGLNVKASASTMSEVDQPWIDLNTIVQTGTVPDRNKLIGEIINEVLGLVGEFENKSFTVFKDEWNLNDALRDQIVELKTNTNQQADKADKKGRVVGVNEQGALLLETDKGVETFHGGEVSPMLVKTS